MKAGVCGFLRAIHMAGAAPRSCFKLLLPKMSLTSTPSGKYASEVSQSRKLKTSEISWPISQMFSVSVAPFPGVATARCIMVSAEDYSPDVVCSLCAQDVHQPIIYVRCCGHAPTDAVLHSRCSRLHGVCVLNGILPGSAGSRLELALLVLPQHMREACASDKESQRRRQQHGSPGACFLDAMALTTPCMHIC